MVERHDVEPVGHGTLADRSKVGAADTGGTFNDHAAGTAGPRARGTQRFVELAFADIDDPGEIRRFAIRRGGAGAKAPHGTAAALQEFKNERKGVAADDRHMGGRP